MRAGLGDGRARRKIGGAFETKFELGAMRAGLGVGRALRKYGGGSGIGNKQSPRMLTIVDTFSRYSPALQPRFAFRGADGVEVLERVGRQAGPASATCLVEGLY